MGPLWMSLLVPAAMADDVEFTCQSSTEVVVGVAPLEVTCEVIPEVPGEWGQTVWWWGDGEVSTGDIATYVYEEPGQYSITVTLEDYEPEGVPDPRTRRDGLINVCGLPKPEFTYIDKGGRNYQLVNVSDVSVPRCIDEVVWTVHRGRDASGEPLFTFDTWEPNFEVPEDGAYFVVLNVVGPAGASAAELQLDAVYGLTDEYSARRATSCATSTPTAWWWLMLAPLGLATLRSRGRRPAA